MCHNGRMINKQFSRLTVTAKHDKPRYWVCSCSCGGVSIARTDHLTLGKVKSCGCLSSEVTAKRNSAGATHRLCNTPTYKSWQSMRTRCLNKNSEKYPSYGGRGIGICQEWNSFEVFLADMGVRPDGFSIDRIDNNKGYSPDNCRWATALAQENNKRINIVLTFDGRSQTVSEWAREMGMGYQTLRKRLNFGWSVERSVSEPVAHKNQSTTAKRPASIAP